MTTLPQATKLRTLCIWLVNHMPADLLSDTVDYLQDSIQHFEQEQLAASYQPLIRRLPASKVRRESRQFFGFPEAYEE